MIAHYFIANTFYVFPFVFLQPFLSVLNYTVVERGILLSGCALVTIFSQFFLGYLCDKYKTNRNFYILIVVLIIVNSFMLYSATHQNFYYHLVIVAMIGGLIRAAMSIQDAWCLEIDYNTKTYFGPIRAFGSLGWMAATPFVAILIGQFGYHSLAYMALIMGSCLIIISLNVKDAQKISSVEPLKAHDVLLLFKDKDYVVIIFILLFINVMDTANAYTVIDKMMLLNASDSLIGIRWSLQALVELPLFLLGTKLYRRFGSRKLVLFGIVMYILKFYLYALVTTPIMMVVVTMLQAVSFPLYMISSKTLIDNVTPATLKSTGQTVAMSLSSGLSLLLVPIISGILINAFSVNTAILILGSTGFISLFLTFNYQEKKN